VGKGVKRARARKIRKVMEVESRIHKRRKKREGEELTDLSASTNGMFS